jgi:hypothetical protein
MEKFIAFRFSVLMWIRLRGVADNMPIIYPAEATSIPFQLIILVISSVIFAAISLFLYQSLSSQKKDLISKIRAKVQKKWKKFTTILLS